MTVPSDWALARIVNRSDAYVISDFHVADILPIALLLDAVRAEVLEEAALEADHLSDGPGVGLATEIAYRIRALAASKGGAR